MLLQLMIGVKAPCGTPEERCHQAAIFSMTAQKAPNMGLEPMTIRLRVVCSTN